MRENQRAKEEMRPVTFTQNYIKDVPGSVLIEVGHTRVICCASIEDRVPPFLRKSGTGWVRGEYSMLPCSSPTRTPRESALGKLSGRTQEIQRLIGRSIRSVFDLNAIGERTIMLDCDVIQADGGTRCASITGSFVALVDLVNHLIKEGVIDRNPIKDSLAAVSVGIVDGDLLLDLEYTEDLRAEVDVNVVMTGKGRFIEIQGTGESTTFTKDDLNKLLTLAKTGIGELTNIQKRALGKRFKW